EDCSVNADPSQIQQVFLNLLTNALHAVENAPRKRVRVTLRREPDAVVAEVADSGAGIPPPERDRIFEPFFTTKDGRGDTARVGTGLGLSVTYGIVEDHGGSIEAGESDLGGAAFSLRLPLERR
ncbi:MAG: sensor histidine kinase, partial [Planctomycetota bacterium]